jgi:hypothetical protein
MLQEREPQAPSEDIRKKLAKVIPRLASPHDGEIVATVRAIVRILDGEKLTLHELAHHGLTGPTEQPPRPMRTRRNRPDR